MIDDDTESWSWSCGIHQKKYLRIALIDYWRNDDYEHSDDDEDGVDDDDDDKGDYDDDNPYLFPEKTNINICMTTVEKMGRFWRTREKNVTRFPLIDCHDIAANSHEKPWKQFLKPHKMCFQEK